MSRYYFNLVNGNRTILDPEGTNLDSQEAAWREAAAGAKAMIADDLRRGGVLTLGRRFDVRNDAGELILTLCFSDAIHYPT